MYILLRTKCLVLSCESIPFDWCKISYVQYVVSRPHTA